MGIVYSYFFGEDEDSSSLENAPSSLDEDCTSDVQHVPNENDIQYRPSPTDEHINDVDKKYIDVKCAGKSVEVCIFPAEKILVLLEEACNHFGKKTDKMKLIFEGEQLDVMQQISHYPKLRSGNKVQLIHA